MVSRSPRAVETRHIAKTHSSDTVSSMPHGGMVATLAIVMAVRILPLLLLLSATACGQGVRMAGKSNIGGTADLMGRRVFLSSLAITPADQTQNVGQTIGFTATGTLSNGLRIDLTRYVVWATNNAQIASFSSLTSTKNTICNAAGTVEITARYLARTGSTHLTCVSVLPPTPTLQSISVTPTDPTVNVGQSLGFTATGTYSDGSTQDLTGTATWASASPSIASLGSLMPQQTVNCLAAGTSLLTATSGSISGTSTITCVATLASISVTPANPSIVAGNTQSFLATGTYSDGSQRDVTLQATWTSGTPSVATIGVQADPQNVVGIAAGTSVITATVGSVSGNTTLTVTSPGGPPPTLTSVVVTPASPTINVGATITFIATCHYSDGSTSNCSLSALWTSSNTAAATISLPNGVVNSPYQAVLSGTGSTPWTFTVPAKSAPGTIDILDYCAMPLPDRNSFHMSATGLYKAYRIDAGLLWWLKNTAGNPWDGEAFDDTYIYQWFTEGPTWGNASGYKKYRSPVPLWKRYHVSGATDTVDTPRPNLYDTTESCGTDNLPPIDNLDIRGVTTGPFTDVNWTTLYGGSIPNGTSYIDIVKYIKGTNGVYQNKEEYKCALGYGQVWWQASHLSGGAYVVDQTSIEATKSAGGAPTPNFACTIPTFPLSGGLPPGSLKTTSTQLDLIDSTGKIQGTPTTPGTYNFTVQQEDGTGAFHIQNQSIVAVPSLALATQAVTVNGVSAGTSTITANVNGTSGSTTLTVANPPPTLSSITVTPANPSINQGQTVSFIATGTFSDSTQRDISSQVTWTSGTPSVATFSGVTGTCVSFGTSTITATLNAVSGNTTLTCNATLSSITVTPANPSVSVGGTISFIATGTYTDSSQRDVTTTATWASSATSIATITSSGSPRVATCAAGGGSTISATVGAVVGNTTLTCVPIPPPPTLQTIAVTPANPSQVNGLTTTFTATGTYSDGSTLNITGSATWTSSNTSVATMSGSVALCVSAGTSTISASFSSRVGFTTLTCTNPPVTLQSITVTPANQTITTPASIGYTATGHYSDASTQNLTGQATWSSSNNTIATVGPLSTTESANCKSAGTVTITATFGAILGTTNLTCNAPVVTLSSITTALVPTTQTVGSASAATATGHYSDSSTANVTTSATWTSSNTAVATIGTLTSTQAVNCVSAGTSLITATIGSVSGSATITCQNPVPTLVSISVTPATPSVNVGSTIGFIATGTYSDNSRQDLTLSATWTSSSTGVATVRSPVANPEIATCVSAGSSTIRAAVGAINGSTTLTCVTPAPTLSSITVSPVNPSVTVGNTIGFIATGHYSDSSTQDLTLTATWTSGTPATATLGAVANPRVATCVAAGTSTISAQVGAVTGNTTLTCVVLPPSLTSITVNPPSPVQYVGSSVGFTATGHYSDGTNQDVTTAATWVSVTTSVMTMGSPVANPEVGSCIAVGTSVVRATVGTISGNTTATCQTPSTGTAENAYCTSNETWIGPTTDGPADLPTHCVYTALSARPSNGTIINVAAGDATAFQNALNSATCGQTIVLQAGSTYTGSFTFPAHNCDSTHWITVRTSGIASLPTEGNRATPCYANVQLTNRPPSPGPGSCPALVAAMAKIKGSGTLDESIRFNAGANDYSLIGLEVESKTTTRTAQTQNIINLQPAVNCATNHIVFDRMWVHGIADRSIVRAGFMQDGTCYIALINSSVTDIHCINGVCTDSQIFQGGLGSNTKTAFKGYNNYVESAGTNSMSFGGGGATVMPSDWEWRRNYQYKPWSWNPACVAPLPPSCALPNGTSVTYDGLGPYSTKNMLEVKDVIRGLIEANTMEGNWMHADQNASAILLTPKNQSGNQCPGCIERHITIRYNHVISSGGFLQAVNTSADDGGLATEGSHYSIHDNLAENLNFLGVVNTGFSFSTYGIQTWTNVSMACGSSFVQHDVSIFHNTLVIAAGRNYNAFHQLDGPIGPCESNMVLRDNLVFYGGQGINQVSNTACAGPTSTNFTAKYTACWTNPFTMTKNAIIGGTGTWPVGNFLPALANVGWVSYNNGHNGDYRLCSGVGVPNASCAAASLYHNAATDGKDVGADLTTLFQKINGTGGVQHSVALGWFASSTAGVSYNVYRGTVSGGPYTKLNSSPVSGLGYTDTAVTSGTTYYYVVRAFDGLNESVNSNQVSGTIP